MKNGQQGYRYSQNEKFARNRGKTVLRFPHLSMTGKNLGYWVTIDENPPYVQERGPQFFVA